MQPSVLEQGQPPRRGALWNLRRYLRTLGLFWSVSISAEAEYRANFFIALLTSVGGLAGNLFGLFLFYRTGHSFEGWSWREALIVLGLFTTLNGVSTTWLRPNLSRIVHHVQKGTLDFVLLKPMDAQFWLSARTLSIWGLADVLLGQAMILYAGAGLGLRPWAWVAALPALAFGVIILYCLWFVLASTSIWFVKVHNAAEVLNSFMDAGRFPMVAYPQVYRIFFTFVVPVAFMTTVPAEAILGRTSLTWMAGAAGLAAGLFLVSRGFWRYALRHYTSASS